MERWPVEPRASRGPRRLNEAPRHARTAVARSRARPPIAHPSRLGPTTREACGVQRRALMAFGTRSSPFALDSFGARATLEVGGKEYVVYRLDALEKRG